MFSALSMATFAVISLGASPDGDASDSDDGLVRIEVDGHPGFIRGLRRDATPQPWVWYAPTLTGAHPDPSHEWMFTRFEAAGLAIAGLDVGESWGGREGAELYEAFHACVTRTWGLADRACLLPQSRGGLMLYAWAIEHPKKVACIAGIYPLTNLESFRAALASRPGVEAVREQITKNHGEGPWVDFGKEVRPLAKRGVPILHVHGKADDVVPLESNSGALANAYREHGGEATLIALEGLGHEVCDGFFKNDALVAFVIQHARGKEGDPSRPESTPKPVSP